MSLEIIRGPFAAVGLQFRRRIISCCGRRAALADLAGGAGRLAALANAGEARLPVASGIGGGSADAAATALRLLCPAVGRCACPIRARCIRGPCVATWVRTCRSASPAGRRGWPGIGEIAERPCPDLPAVRPAAGQSRVSPYRPRPTCSAPAPKRVLVRDAAQNCLPRGPDASALAAEPVAARATTCKRLPSRVAARPIAAVLALAVGSGPVACSLA